MMRKSFISFVLVVFMALSAWSGVWAAAGVEVSGDLTLSGTGGVVFPDGTSQTTASKPTWSQKISGGARWMLVLDDMAVLDKETGLVWQRQSDAQYRSYSAGIDYCRQLGLGQRMGWRLPTIEELATLVDTYIGGLPSGHLFIANAFTLDSGSWSSTIDADPNYAWYVDFHYGAASRYLKTNIVYVRCVRG